MRDLLNNGYTIFISMKDNKVTGVGLKELNNGEGITTKELDEKRVQVFGELPNIGEKLADGETLQLYKSYEKEGIRFVAQMGRISREEAYGEVDCFNVSSEVQDEEFLGAIIILNEEIKNQGEKETPPKRLVRNYGKVTYK